MTRFKTFAGHRIQGRRRVNRKFTSINKDGIGFITPIECANGAIWDLNIICVFDNCCKKKLSVIKIPDERKKEKDELTNRLWLATVWKTLSKGRPSRTVKD